MAIAKTIDAWDIPNPYYETFLSGFGKEHPDIFDTIDCPLRGSDNRLKLVTKYAWAVPCPVAIDICLRHSPLLEVGAGTGYWASLIAHAGGDIRATDDPNKRYKHFGARPVEYYKITKISELQMIELVKLGRRTVLMCWPNYATPFAFNIARAIQPNKRLIYIGESDGGCTGDDKFHHLLHAEFEQESELRLPQWPGIHDYLYVYRRI